MCAIKLGRKIVDIFFSGMLVLAATDNYTIKKG